jgi:Ni/Fe-hydrogenase subunit HybB-like protein
MGLIIPGFIPSTLHEIVEYVPSITEWKVTAGVWAFGLMIYTAALKVALPVLSGEHGMGAERSAATGLDHRAGPR